MGMRYCAQPGIGRMLPDCEGLREPAVNAAVPHVRIPALDIERADNKLAEDLVVGQVRRELAQIFKLASATSSLIESQCLGPSFRS